MQVMGYRSGGSGSNAAEKFVHQQHIHNDCMTACGTESVEKAQHEK